MLATQALLNLGITEKNRESAAAALTYLAEGTEELDRHEAEHEPSTMSRRLRRGILLCTAGAHVVQGRFTSAAEELDETAVLAAEAGGQFHGVLVTEVRGQLHLRAQRYPEALVCLREALEQFEAEAHRESVASTLSSIGQALSANGDEPAARAAWARALPMFEAQGDPRARELAERLGPTC
ncbi:tetratricopeptide repeat protein [Catenulispora sp. GP43]|uniref:tetratricopeptide repeat protein n=1 Tax=Catenulispora sp. GP43 TaxID=3156263 RepID=UPI00351510B8